MFLVGIISWWYGRGWHGQLQRMRERLTATADFFSIGQLTKTLFSPFRQISAEGVDGSLAVVARAFFDRLISRTIGAFVRLFTILVGILVLTFQFLYEVIVLLLWLLIPVFPVVGLVMMAIGWVPRWM